MSHEAECAAPEPLGLLYRGTNTIIIVTLGCDIKFCKYHRPSVPHVHKIFLYDKDVKSLS